MIHSTTRCPCCGLPHERVEIFATKGTAIKLWYICPEFGQRVRVAIPCDDEPDEPTGN
jgi:hypothetical protein